MARDEFFTVRDLADRWGVTTKTIHRRVRAGTIPAPTKPAGRWLFKVSDIKRYEEEAKKSQNRT